MIIFGSFLPSLLVGFSTTNFTRASEPTLSWNQLHSLTTAWSLSAPALHALTGFVRGSQTVRFGCGAECGYSGANKEPHFSSTEHARNGARLLFLLDCSSWSLYFSFLLIFSFCAAISTPPVFAGPLRSTSLAKSSALKGYSCADSCPVGFEVMSTLRL